MHLWYVLYPTTIINSWYLTGPSLLIKSVSLNHVLSVGKYDWKMEGQSALFGIIMSALVCDVCPFRCPSECFTEIFELFAVDQPIRLQYLWKIRVTEKNVAQSSVEIRVNSAAWKKIHNCGKILEWQVQCWTGRKCANVINWSEVLKSLAHRATNF